MGHLYVYLIHWLCKQQAVNPLAGDSEIAYLPPLAYRSVVIRIEGSRVSFTTIEVAKALIVLVALMGALAEGILKIRLTFRFKSIHAE